jgi:hypothetical protein
MLSSEASKLQDFFKSDDPIFGSPKTAPGDQSSVPSSATMLVSLFLILIVFFTVIISNSNMDAGKKNAVMESVKEKFGKVEDDTIRFGQVMPIKINDITKQLLSIFGEDAKIETSIDGSQTIVTLKKSSFFYNDETNLRGEKYEKMIELQRFLKTQEIYGKLHVTLLMGLEEYQKDSTRLNNMKNIIGYNNMDIGLTANDKVNVKTVFENE